MPVCQILPDRHFYPPLSSLWVNIGKIYPIIFSLDKGYIQWELSFSIQRHHSYFTKYGYVLRY